MTTAAFIAGDWGTSHLRLYLCADDGVVLDHAEGPGAADARDNCASVLSQLLSRWQRDASLPVLLCGMVGSSIGWKQVNPLSCPVAPHTIAAALDCVQRAPYPVYIVPGLRCRNIVDAPDFMRGEETQILGAMQLQSQLSTGTHLLALPGTHTKWVIIRDGSVDQFLTAPTGELYSLLCKFSVLVHDKPPTTPTSSEVNAAFNQGVTAINRFPKAGLLDRLFECRSRRLTGELAAADASSFLSGLLIGTDVRDALELLSDASPGLSFISGQARQVVIVGSSALCDMYAEVLSERHCAATIITGEAAVCAGLTKIFQLMRQNGELQ